ncbi:hypothetical protein ANN_12811 [Periplaneta americana]|uniref:Uncharacterized protein n=1 Tax=Periplaneta americana TaxID=6978 RepID=A0ABQ8TJS2_PERAM|nr:hypothetical protein ANN_12811 [Periplaneta americana]
MSPGSSTESYPAFARIGLRENPGKNLNQVTCPDRDSNPGHLVSRPDALTVTPQKTGTPLDVVGRFQINLLLQPHGDIALFRNVPTIYFPMLWLEKTASIPNYLAFQLNILLHLPTIGLCISIILIITGVVMLAVVIVPRYRQQFDFHPHKGETPIYKSQRDLFTLDGIRSLVTPGKQHVVLSPEESSLINTTLANPVKSGIDEEKLS